MSDAGFVLVFVGKVAIAYIIGLAATVAVFFAMEYRAQLRRRRR